MSHLSDKELLEVLADFPKHELTTIQRTEMLKKFSSSAGSHKPKRQFPVQRIAALAAVFILILIAPILYFTNGGDSAPRSGSTNIEAQEGDYFALKDESGKPLYGDSNFGIPNKVSLLAPKEWVVWDQRATSKIMVFLWGKDLAPDPTLSIDATHEATGIKQHLSTSRLSGGMYGADAHALVTFTPFDKRGKWNLEFTVSNTSGEKRKIGEFPIYVKDHYVLLGSKGTLLISQEDLYAGFYNDAYIEVSGENLPEEIELEITSEEDPTNISKFTFKEKTDYTTTDGEKISMYKGDFQIKKSGRYSFGVLGESNPVIIGKPTDQ
ncbi:hypothetical protein BABA_17592 [Neobacillus bataviensis LMG 21833]|uniref:Uncharacterized protein n=1 Tax=Neobacillus bataviensis LMG 21833 TaxID=1117379 RepID=K6C4F0_9BACI|nr:hypothetical protein [Neobacillus bataviensis]EKN65980.1 hypothetical protein BABA_17592 [Neobacillus bataviensis LMG 21833]